MSDLSQYRSELNRAVDDAIACQCDLQAAKRELFYSERADSPEGMQRWRLELRAASEASDGAIAKLNRLLRWGCQEPQGLAAADQAVAAK